ncbi:MAG: bifunctional adenosylcobinamide kinase/adenosylcobinamide-phosphate guanylyltransferase, partial [Spirochaetia bacterium]|nr:bifunctional adenosylcobinamide kinase/adenosylcobinamide-phosphate guanylyltransferase [Spirochaetia bacterium]
MCKNEIYFILGGSRSGKSSYALNLAETFRSEKTFIATCPVFDPEMELRIQN